jgi:hypothetical protein
VKIYVIGKWEEKPRVDAFMRKLERLGHEITYDWTRVDGTKADVVNEARNDLDGVLNAQLVVCLYHPKARGGLVEIGAALSNGKPVWLVGAPPLGEDTCVFLSLCNYIADEERALEALVLAASLEAA